MAKRVRTPSLRFESLAFRIEPGKGVTREASARAVIRRAFPGSNWTITALNLRTGEFEATLKKERRSRSAGGGDDDPGTETSYQWSLDAQKVPQAWSMFGSRPPGGGVVVGHPDTGYATHPEIAGPRLRVADGYDFEDGRADPRDPLNGGLLRHPSHGTSTSSLIISGRGLQPGSPGPAFVSGTAPGASLIPIRTTASVVLWSMSRLTKAVHYAVSQGAHVISISLGGPVPSTALHNAMREAEERGVIVLCAAGNQVRFVVFPAAFDEVIAVAASAIDDTPWPGSCRGPAVDITAPGSSVWRARTELKSGAEQYKVERGSGTSYAVAPTAGVAALWLSCHGRNALVASYGRNRLAGVFKQLLQETCRKVPGWDTNDFGPGIVNAKALLGAVLPANAPARGLRGIRRRAVSADRDALEVLVHQLAPREAGRAREGAPIMSLPVLVGRIAVGVIWVDSTVAAIAITDNEKSKTLSETTEGLNLLATFEPRAKIQWFYDVKRPRLSLTAAQAGNEDPWRDAAMAAMGYSANLAGMNTYLSDIKAASNADWSYALFITKYPKTWFAYYWGNHVVMDVGVDGWGIDNFSIVLAHETGHVFGCGDEYASSGCTCASLHGRYQVANGNCENRASPFIPCLMAHNTPALCDYSRGQLGWNELAVQSKGTTVLKGTWTFDFDTGVQGPAGGADIWWEQVNSVVRYLVPQSGAMLAHMGKPGFDAVSYQTLEGLSYTATPIAGSNNSANKLTAGAVVAIKTSAGRCAKMKINSYGYSLNITWVTYK